MKTPTYLRYTFLEVGDGFQFSASPPEDIASIKYIKSSDPWEALSAILANLHRGRFSVIDEIVELLKKTDDLVFWEASAILLGHAAPRALIHEYYDCFADIAHELHQVCLCTALTACGDIGGIDRILAIYEHLLGVDTKNDLQSDLSWLLETVPGPIWLGPKRASSDDEDEPGFLSENHVLDLPAYISDVREKKEQMKAKINLAETSIVAEGSIFDLQKMLQSLLMGLRSGGPRYRIEKARMSFEATTGLNCKAFYNNNYVLQPLAAAAIVEDFLSSGAFAEFEPGARYFFGHRIPN